jgi:hypothetical protein
VVHTRCDVTDQRWRDDCVEPFGQNRVRRRCVWWRGRGASDFRGRGRDRRAEAAAKLSEGLLEGCGCQRFEREIEDVAVGAEAFEGPREVGLRRDP